LEEAERVRAEKVERDRALAAQSKALARVAELRTQARQIIEDRKVLRTGEREYRFSVDGAISTLLVTEDLRQKLAAACWRSHAWTTDSSCCRAWPSTRCANATPR
jgi:uncharacterized protein YaiL (DUF2058 family)